MENILKESRYGRGHFTLLDTLATYSCLWRLLYDTNSAVVHAQLTCTQLNKFSNLFNTRIFLHLLNTKTQFWTHVSFNSVSNLIPVLASLSNYKNCHHHHQLLHLRSAIYRVVCLPVCLYFNFHLHHRLVISLFSLSPFLLLYPFPVTCIFVAQEIFRWSSCWLTIFSKKCSTPLVVCGT